jgi:Tfp pilus assembly protein PilZ
MAGGGNTSGGKGSDRRVGERVVVNREFREVAGDGLSAFVEDLSDQGAFVRTDADLPLGAMVQLRFTVLLDDPVVLQCKAEVVRRQPGGDGEPRGVGVRFVELDAITQLRIHDAVSRGRPRQLGAPVSGPLSAGRGADPSPEDSFEGRVTGIFEPVGELIADEDVLEDSESSGAALAARVQAVLTADDDAVTRAHRPIEATIVEDEDGETRAHRVVDAPLRDDD